MNFANPWAFWLALAAVPVIVGFLIRRFRRRRQVPALVIYRRLMGASASRRGFARPQHLIALLLCLLALAALGLAVLDPLGSQIPPHKYVFLLDVSESMATREIDEEQTRLDRARTELANFVENLNAQDEVSLVTMGAEANLRVGWTTEHEAVVRAAHDLVPVGSATGRTDGFLIADALCQDPTVTEIVLISDGAGTAVPPLDCPLRYAREGAAANNVAITGLTVREADALGLNEIYLALHNGSSYEREIRTELYLDGNLIDVEAETVPAATTVERLLRLPLGNGEILEAHADVTGENALLADDVAYAVMRPGARVATLLLTDHPTTFLAEALRLHPRVDLTVATPAEVAAFAGPYDLLVIDTPYPGVLPQAAHMVMLEASTPWLPVDTSGLVREPQIIRWSFEHSLFRFVNLDNIHISEATATRLPDGAVSLMDMADGPLLFQMEHDGRDLLYFTFHPDRSDLPLRVAFVNMVANIIEWAQPIDNLRVTASLGTGERLAADDTGLVLERITQADAGIPTRIDARDPVPAAGIYHLISGEGVTRATVAANLFSVHESDVMPVYRLGVGAMQGWPEVFRAEEFPWWMLAVGALVLLFLEWVLPVLLGGLFRRHQKRQERRPLRATAPWAAITGSTPTVSADNR